MNIYIYIHGNDIIYVWSAPVVGEAAVVAALLQAFTEPVLNRVAVKRMTVGAAIRAVRLIAILRFFRTVLATMPGWNRLEGDFGPALLGRKKEML